MNPATRSMPRTKVDLRPDQDLLVLYNAAARRALALRRELSVLAHASGIGGDREMAILDQANAFKVMDSMHEELKRLAKVRVPVPHADRQQ